MFSTPYFWKKRTLISFILLPFSFIYLAVKNIKDFFTKEFESTKPIICVGNLIAGGSGKTPTAIAIGKILQKLIDDKYCNHQEKKSRFAFLNSGYLSKNKTCREINFEKNQQKYSAQEIGDEAMILAKNSVTYIAKNKISAIKKIEKNPEIISIIMDDGMQNKSIKKNLNILVIDEKIKFGNSFLIPAGPLRERIDSGIKKSDLIILIKNKSEKNFDEDNQKKFYQQLPQEKIISANLKAANFSQFQNVDLLAFCAIGYPEKFYAFLNSLGLKIKMIKSFPDHHNYKNSEIEKLIKIAEENSYKLITTEKDWVKFDEEFQNKIDFLSVELIFENPEKIKNALAKII
jgi:tetraacyldisaccharide 4'-kinase